MNQSRLKSSLVGGWRWGVAQIKPFLRFGIIGLAAALLDFALFNLFAFLQSQNAGLTYSPLTNKIVSLAISTVFAWLGNRYWTFRASRRRAVLKELGEFSLVAFGGIVIAVGTLWFSHYVLGLTNIVADNISANVIGLVLSTIFRYVLYRYWVFGTARKHHVSEGVSQ